MIRYVWGGKVAAGKTAQAMEWIQKVMDFYKRYDGMPTIETFSNMFGESGVIVFMSDHADLAAFQKIDDQVSNDPEYIKFADESAGIIVEGSVNTYLMKSA